MQCNIKTIDMILIKYSQINQILAVNDAQGFDVPLKKQTQTNTENPDTILKYKRENNL